MILILSYSYCTYLRHEIYEWFLSQKNGQNWFAGNNQITGFVTLYYV